MRRRFFATDGERLVLWQSICCKAWPRPAKDAIQKDHAMISAVSSSNATALLALFGRNTSNATANPTQTTAPRAPAPPPPLPQGSGATAQSLFDALVRGADGGPADANAPSLDDLLSNLMTGLDTDGDGRSEIRLRHPDGRRARPVQPDPDHRHRPGQVTVRVDVQCHGCR